jgi:hypothetical protein
MPAMAETTPLMLENLGPEILAMMMEEVGMNLRDLSPDAD